MFRSLRKTIVSLLSAATLVLVPVAVPALASADNPTSPPATGNTGGTTPTIQDCLGQGSSLTAPATDTDCSNASVSNGGTNVNHIITTIINVFSFVVGVVAVIMIIVGGFRYITSGGDSGNVSSAKNTIIYAIIGLVVVALAQFIVQFVLQRVTGTA